MTVCEKVTVFWILLLSLYMHNNLLSLYMHNNMHGWNKATVFNEKNGKFDHLKNNLSRVHK